MSYGVDDLAGDYGSSAMELAQVYIYDSCVPAICTECGSTYEYEPDCSEGYCEECESKTVQSLFILLGIM